MEAGPFAAGEILADALNNASIGSFLLTPSGPVWVVGLPAPGRAHRLILPLSGDRAFINPGLSPAPRSGLRITGRSREITLGTMLGNVDPSPGDLGIDAEGQMAVAIRLVDGSGSHDLLMSLASGEQTEFGESHYVWSRQWRLELVSTAGDRKVTLVDRF